MLVSFMRIGVDASSIMAVTAQNEAEMAMHQSHLRNNGAGWTSLNINEGDRILTLEDYMAVWGPVIPEMPVMPFQGYTVVGAMGN